MKTYLRPLLTAALIALSPAAKAGEANVVVELFTSQGCSSCPPADAMLSKLTQQDGVIALAYHVDYWDYLGWKDTFAMNAFTQRQMDYVGHTNREWIRQRLRGKFTPEIIVQGTDSMVGHDSRAVMKRVHAHAKAMPAADIDLRLQGDMLEVKLATPETLGTLRVMLAQYVPQQTVSIERGENRGRTLTYSHVVTKLRYVGDWDGSGSDRMTLKGVEGPVVIFLQKGEAGPILAAAELN
ncbi:DUF1223 domain-containing protein [Halovulum sp. GXIMD14793]